MEGILDQLGVLKQFVSFEAMIVIYLVVEAIKEIVNRLKIISPKMDLPDSLYPAFSVIIGGLLSLVKELNITLMVGLCSGMVLTVVYKKFESWINKLGIKK